MSLPDDGGRVERPACATCNDTGLHFTGAFVGDDANNLRAVCTRCPDCDAGRRALKKGTKR